MNKINSGHFLMSCRLDNWVRLLRKADCKIDPSRLPQLLAMLGSSLALTPVALLEKAVFDKKIRAAKPTDDPIFIIGHWRSGTTYLQNILSRDPQFGWADPVSTVAFPVSLLLGRALRGTVERGIAAARPYDNVQYAMDHPMEETFATLTISPHCIIDLLAFPLVSERFLDGAFIDDLPEAEQRKWRRDYDYVVKKLSYICSGRRLILKSPDNTARMRQLLTLYPQARFINIHRDPYKVIRSTINMFHAEIDSCRLTKLPENANEIVEDTVIYLFRRMYEELFALEAELPRGQIIDIAYSDFCRAPVETLERIYTEFGLSGFAEAKPRFEAFAAAERNYKKNSFDLSPTLIEKINAELDFYFVHYGYEMREAAP